MEYTAAGQGSFANLKGAGNLVFNAGSTLEITEGAFTYNYLGNDNSASFVLTAGEISVSGAAYPTFTLDGFATAGQSTGAPGGAAILVDHTFVVDSGSELTIPGGLLLDVTGTLTNNGSIVCDGTLTGSGTIPGEGITGSGTWPGK